MILNIILVYLHEKIKPAFSDPTVVLRCILIEPVQDGAGTLPDVPLF
jgi:hypothetical protein